jgi:hypothetical protein
MKLIDDNTSTQVEFKPPHRFSTIQTLKVIATTFSFMREFASQQPVDELIDSLQMDGDALVVTWKIKPSGHERDSIDWIWQHVAGLLTTRHYFEGEAIE